MKRPLYLVAEDWYFCSHRLSLATAARDAGYEVVVATRVTDHGERIRSDGLQLVPLGLSCRGENPFREIGSVAEIVGVYPRVSPT